MASKVLISHSRGTKREGAVSLFCGVAAAVGLVVFLHLFFGWVRKEDPFLYFAFLGIVLIVGGLLVFAYAIPNLLMNREFRFVLFEDRIECKSPAKAFGESYSISIDEIVRLEEETGNDGPNSWRFVTRDNRCLKITPNYRNPVRKIVAALRQLRPELPVSQVPRFCPIQKPSNDTTT